MTADQPVHGRANRTPGLDDAPVLIGATSTFQTSLGTREHISPMTGRPQAEYALAGAVEVDASVDAAAAAFGEWQAMAAHRRKRVLLAVAEAVSAAAEELVRITVLEGGTPSGLAAHAPRTAAAWITYYAEWIDKHEGRVVPVSPGRGFDFTRTEPYGVVGVIIPWNGPLISIGMKVGPALAAGNCVVLKPPELSPFAAVRFGELALQAGLPPGVLNVLPGGVEAGERLVRHPGIAKVSFTGGSLTARQVIAAAGENLTPLTLELGGKSPNLVFADADLDASARFATEYGLVARSGQGCLLPTRTLVQRSVYEQFVERVVTAADAVVVGDPFEAATAMGPVISEQACDRILGMIQTAVSEKMGRLVAGGDRLGGPLADGYYLQPTVFADVDPTSPLAKEEIFGPVLSIMPFDTEDEAVEMANDSVYGLAAYLSTSDLNRVQRLFPRLAAGSVYVNGHPGMIPSIPVGGHRQSGWGREGGKDGLEDFLQVKNVFIAGP